MTFTYVIISSENDYILEQAMVSMHSLKMFNPEAHITAVMDYDTQRGLTGNRSKIKEYINDLLTPEIPENLNKTQQSRFLKTSLRKIISGDFLYLDNDTVVTDNMSEIKDLPFDVAATLNMHRKDWSKDNPHSMIIRYYGIVGKDIQKDLKITDYYNGGVIFSKDTPIAHSFFDKWHKLWLKDSEEFNYYKDQISMWEANYQLGNIIKELDPRYNCQMVYPVYAMKYFDSAKVLHYFSSTQLANPLKLTDSTFLMKIRNYGVDKEDEKYIKELKQIYKDILNITIENALVDYHIEKTAVCYVGKKISLHFPWLNRPVQALLNYFGKIREYYYDIKH